MEVRPIDANALFYRIQRAEIQAPDLVCKAYVLADVADMIHNAPTLDYEPVRHGEWVEEIEPNVVTASGRDVHLWRCSACGFSWANKHDVMSYYKYCPNCGAKMRKGDA